MNTKEKKSVFKRWWFWVLIVIVLIGIGGAMGGGDDATKTTNNNTTDNKNEEEKTEFKVGETASFDDKSITVTKVQRNYDTGNQFAQPESGKEFVIVTVKITNDSDSTLDYNTFEFKMQDSDGVQQNEAITALSEGKLDSGSLAKNGKVTGNLAYEVPKGDKGLKLLYQNFSFFDNKAVTFNLK
jgi:hypothetical protein